MASGFPQPVEVVIDIRLSVRQDDIRTPLKGQGSEIFQPLEHGAELGAAAVQVGSALLDEPLLVARLAVDLEEAYARWNVSDFSQLREVLCRHMQS